MALAKAIDELPPDHLALAERQRKTEEARLSWPELRTASKELSKKWGLHVVLKDLTSQLSPFPPRGNLSKGKPMDDCGKSARHAVFVAICLSTAVEIRAMKIYDLVMECKFAGNRLKSLEKIGFRGSTSVSHGDWWVVGASMLRSLSHAALEHSQTASLREVLERYPSILEDEEEADSVVLSDLEMIYHSISWRNSQKVQWYAGLVF